MVLSFGTLCGQSNLKQIYGYVVDTAGVNLKGVTVRMTSTSDTAVVTSSSSGYYSFKNVKGANIRVSYSMLGHKIVSKSVSFAENATSLLIPNVILEPQNSFIEDVYVVKTIPVVYTDDTIHYNMDAFKFRQNSLLEEALKQLPGIQVSRDGTVYAQGKAISSVQVDGKNSLMAMFLRQLEICRPILSIKFRSLTIMAILLRIAASGMKSQRRL